MVTMRTESEDVPRQRQRHLSQAIVRPSQRSCSSSPSSSSSRPPEAHRRSGYRRRPPRVADGLALAYPEIPSVVNRSGSSDATSSSRANCLAMFASWGCQSCQPPKCLPPANTSEHNLVKLGLDAQVTSLSVAVHHHNESGICTLVDQAIHRPPSPSVGLPTVDSLEMSGVLAYRPLELPLALRSPCYIQSMP